MKLGDDSPRRFANHFAGRIASLPASPQETDQVCSRIAKAVVLLERFERRSTVSEVGSAAGQAAVGAGPSGSQASGSTNLPNSSLLGGELPGGVKMKLGDKVINLRGNVGVGDNGGNFKAGVGLAF
jgi:hypothetical protein